MGGVCALHVFWMTLMQGKSHHGRVGTMVRTVKFTTVICLATVAICASLVPGFSDTGSFNWFGIISGIAICAAAGLIFSDFSKPAENGGHDNVYKSTDPTEQHPAISELSSQIIWMADKNGNLTYFNQRWFDYTGFGKEDALGDGWLEILHPDQREDCMTKWQEALDTGTLIANEYLLRRFDGVYRWHLGKGVPLKDEQGNILNWFGICIDVHDQRITAAASAILAERLVLAMEAGETGTFEVYPDTGEAIWSDQCRAILGVPKSSLPGIEAMMNLVHPEDQGRLSQLMDALRSANPPAEMDLEYRIIRADGELRWIAAKGRSSRNSEIPGGKRFTGVVTDITIRKQAEQERLAFMVHIEAAREKERTYVAREIHDELGQTLTAVKMDVAWIKKRVLEFESLGDVTDRADDSLILLDQSIQTVRRISTELRPGVLDDLGLCAAVEWLARTFAIHTNVVPTLHIEMDDSDLPVSYQTALFRVSQEALTNITRHAEATQVVISLIRDEAGIKLTITDNGCGFSTVSKHGRSFGVIGMRERISALGGQFNVHSNIGQGTTIMALLPFPGTIS
jgi:PAS domain S-box-containing protein